MDKLDDNERPEVLHQLERFSDFSTPTEEREALAQKLFPENRKELFKLGAEKDTKGRPVTIHRLVGPDELRKILLQGEVNATDNSQVKETFAKHHTWIQQFLHREVDPSTPGFSELMADFTEEKLSNFLYTKLPRKELTRLHKYQTLGNLSGLLSCSVGAPFQPPGPTWTSLEMIVPSTEIIIPLADGLRYEREIILERIKRDWVIDAYPTEEDFEQRFLQNPDYSVSIYFGRSTDSEGRSRSSFDAIATLQDWTYNETMATLLPVSKVLELDPNHPIQNQPLRKE